MNNAISALLKSDGSSSGTQQKSGSLQVDSKTNLPNIKVVHMDNKLTRSILRTSYNSSYSDQQLSLITKATEQNLTYGVKQHRSFEYQHQGDSRKGLLRKSHSTLLSDNDNNTASRRSSGDSQKEMKKTEINNYYNHDTL